jgi:uncharacterized protein (TIGR03435 family)
MRNDRVKTSIAAVLFAMGIALGQAFAPRRDLKFEVGTVKPSPPDEPGGGVRPAPGATRYVGTALDLRSYLYVAYQVKTEQIIGGPSWVDKEHYDLNAETDKPRTIEDLHIMLQNFLTGKFKLQFHFEKRDMQAYVLTADKGGPKNLITRGRTPGADYIADYEPAPAFHQKWKFHCASIDFFTWRLAAWFDRPILNQTGLEGCYDFEFSYTQDLPAGVQDGQMFNGAAVDASGPDVYRALQSELGLKMEAKRAPVEVMVIDHAERPSED